MAKLHLPTLREELTSSRILFADFLKAGLVMNIVAVVIGILIIYGMGSRPEPKSVEFRVLSRMELFTLRLSSRLSSDADSCPHIAAFLGFGEVLPVRGLPRTKIRAESSSNGSDLRSAGFTPHKIRAELSSNGSSRVSFGQKIRAESSSNGSCRVSFGPVSTRTRAHGRWQFMSLMKDFLLVPSVSVIALDGSA